MSGQGRWTRRAVLRSLGLLGIAGFAPAALRRAGVLPRRSDDIAATILEAGCVNGESAAVVGREYLRVAPHEADERRLTELVLGERSHHASPVTDQDALSDRIARMRRRDFELGRTVRLDGWVLSITEARLCALAALRT